MSSMVETRSGRILPPNIGKRTPQESVEFVEQPIRRVRIGFIRLLQPGQCLEQKVRLYACLQRGEPCFREPLLRGCAGELRREQCGQHTRTPAPRRVYRRGKAAEKQHQPALVENASDPD